MFKLHCIIVDSSYHIHFDNDGWLLLPHPDILDKFKSTLKRTGVGGFALREYFPKFDQVCRLSIITRLSVSNSES